MNVYLNQPVFTSLSGEIGFVPQGTPTAFIRMQECNLRCFYCDTKDSQPSPCFYCDTKDSQPSPKKVGQVYTLTNTGKLANQIIRLYMEKSINHFLFTGGEPLLQQKAIVLLLYSSPMIMELIANKKIIVSIETNGTIIPSKELCSLVHEHSVKLIVDIKNQTGTLSTYGFLSKMHKNYKRDKEETFLSICKNILFKYVVWNEEILDQSIASITNQSQKLNNCISPILTPFDLEKAYPYGWKDYSKFFHVYEQKRIFNVPINIQIHKLISIP